MHSVRSYAGRHPDIFYPLYGLREKNRRLFVNASTEIVIEGYPRCGNTFAVVAFEYAQKKPVSIAHHLHVPAQVLRGVEQGIPVLVLIRKPLDAISSLMVRHPHVEPEKCLKDYLDFYSLILPRKDGFVCADFADVSSRYGDVIHKVNERFGTGFDLFSDSREDVERVFSRIEDVNRMVDTGDVRQVARPAKEKERPKQMARDILSNGKYSGLIAAADELYGRFLLECGKR